MQNAERDVEGKSRTGAILPRFFTLYKSRLTCTLTRLQL
jgi:hypothetical protein